jgi:hypothetical protein
MPFRDFSPSLALLVLFATLLVPAGLSIGPRTAVALCP